MKKWIPLVLALTAPAGAADRTDASAKRTVQDKRGGASPRRAEQVLAAVARAAAQRRGAEKRSARGVEREQERQVEGRDPRQGLGHARRVGRPDLRADRHRHRQTSAAGCGSAPDAPPAGGPGSRRGPRSIAADAIHQFAIVAIARRDGKVLWQRVVREELPHEGTHPTASFASSSAVTDGERVYAFFGSRGLYALDMAGKSSGRRTWAT